jgi:hypothetical protein
MWMYSPQAIGAVTEFLASEKYSCEMDTSMTGKVWGGIKHGFNSLFGG